MVTFKKKKKLDIFLHLLVKIYRDDVFALASQLAYYLMLSFFPFILFLMTLIGFSSISSIEVINSLNGLFPESVVDLTRTTVMEIFDNQYTGLLGVSIFLMIWTSSAAFRAIIKSVNKAYHLDDSRSFLKIIGISMLGILELATIIMLALFMFVFGDVIETYIKNIMPFQNVMLFLWNIGRYVCIVVIMVIIFAGIYCLSPAKRLKFREVLYGSIFSTIGWVIVSFGFSFYIDNFSNYSRFYGSLGAVFILMTWLFLISLIFILGVEINYVIKESNLLRNNNLQ